MIRSLKLEFSSMTDDCLFSAHFVRVYLHVSYSLRSLFVHLGSEDAQVVGHLYNEKLQEEAAPKSIVSDEKTRRRLGPRRLVSKVLTTSFLLGSSHVTSSDFQMVEVKPIPLYNLRQVLGCITQSTGGT